MKRAVLLLSLLLTVGAGAPALAHEETEPVTREELDERKRELREEAREVREMERELRRKERRRASRRPPSWAINLGSNVAHVDFGEENCWGAQGGLTMGWPLMLRLQRTHVTYEADDDTQSCDGGWSGDAEISEGAALIGLAFGRSGWYVAGGMADVDVEQTAFGPWGGDTGARYELGWSSRMRGWPVGLEVLAFRTENDIRDYNGVAIGLLLGPGSR